MHRVADAQAARVRLLLTRQHTEQRRLARAVGADDADDAAGRQLELEILEQELVAIGFRNPLRLDDQAAQALRDRDEDLRRTGALLLALGEQLFIGVDARLRLRLARLGRRGDPFALA